MENKITHDIIKDLLPSYVDEICSEDSKAVVEEHLRDCNECREAVECMRRDVVLSKGSEMKAANMLTRMKSAYRKGRIALIVFWCGVVLFTLLHGMRRPGFSLVYCAVLEVLLIVSVYIYDKANRAEYRLFGSPYREARGMGAGSRKEGKATQGDMGNGETCQSGEAGENEETGTNGEPCANERANGRVSIILTVIAVAAMLYGALMFAVPMFMMSKGTWQMEAFETGPFIDWQLWAAGILLAAVYLLSILLSSRWGKSFLWVQTLAVFGICLMMSLDDLMRRMEPMEGVLRLARNAILLQVFLYGVINGICYAIFRKQREV